MTIGSPAPSGQRAASAAAKPEIVRFSLWPAPVAQPAQRQLHDRLAAEQDGGQSADFGAAQVKTIVAEDDEKADAHQAQAADGIAQQEAAEVVIAPQYRRQLPKVVR